jgi:hypothetical protein
MSDTLSNFTGSVTGLSFDSRVGGCQATLFDGTAQRGTTQPITVTTTEPRMQTLLETSMLKNVPIVVVYKASEDKASEDNLLISVSISLGN